MGDRSRQRARCCALGLAALAFAHAERAVAEPAPVAAPSAVAAPTPSAVAASAPASAIPEACGTRSAFDAELRERLGPDAPLDDVQVSISPRDDRFHLRVQIKNEVRELDDANCSELLRAAVVVTLAVLMHEREQPPTPAPPSPPPTSPPPLPRYPRWSFDAGAGFVAGSLPKPVLALELESKALWRRFGVGLALRYLAPSETRDAENKGVQVQAFAASVVGIFRPASRWEARLGLAATRLDGSGLGAITETQHDVSWNFGPSLGLGVTVLEERPFWLGLGAEGQLNALRGRFQIRNYSGEISNELQDVWVAPWLAASGFVRLGLVF